MQNTVTVIVHRYQMHEKYGKRFRLSSKFLADTNGQTVGVGDEVTIAECKPISKRKYFKVTEILKKATLTQKLGDEMAEEGVKRDHRDSQATKKKVDTPVTQS